MTPAEACAEFVRWALTEGCWSGCDLEGGAIQEKALSLGLLKVEPYDPEKHGETEHYVEIGDDWYTLTDAVLALSLLTK